ncbi:HEPN domain-containing protein [Brucella pecoris]|uniref:HEPN domain-containing protein n=1 Tax=Brucella pecoris TaxID=867683 RepID=A0A5C5CBV1_9HYPH|nr:HEPN domain-containing protein [Brucella pecoris]MBB4096160.1 HEPN domain-containing protein [Brucella pecoris]TNV08823.1 HEPN domain-containing protein [Brucella pecoris]
MKNTRRRLVPETASHETLVERFNHLGRNRSLELRRVVRILFDEFEEAQRGKLSDKKKGGRILKLVLFGSPADGGGAWGEHCESPRTCQAGNRYSDFNLLVIVSSQFFASPRIWKRAQERFLHELTVTGHLSTRVNFIVHSIMDINDQLANGRSFFTEIVRNGTMLYEAPGSLLVDPTPPGPEVAKIEIQQNFDHWFSGALHRFELASKALERGFYREAAFDLHQTVERLYHCVLHVQALYSPKSHRLTFLRAHAERIAPQLTEVWSDNSSFASRCFDRLDRAYIGARYSRSYEITREELEWLTDGVNALREAVAAICLQHLDKPNCAAT